MQINPDIIFDGIILCVLSFGTVLTGVRMWSDGENDTGSGRENDRGSDGKNGSGSRTVTFGRVQKKAQTNESANEKGKYNIARICEKIDALAEIEEHYGKKGDEIFDNIPSGDLFENPNLNISGQYNYIAETLYNIRQKRESITNPYIPGRISLKKIPQSLTEKEEQLIDELETLKMLLVAERDLVQTYQKAKKVEKLLDERESIILGSMVRDTITNTDDESYDTSIKC